MSLAAVSFKPPGANGTMMRTRCVGKLCECAAPTPDRIHRAANPSLARSIDRNMELSSYGVSRGISADTAANRPERRGHVNAEAPGEQPCGDALAISRYSNAGIPVARGPRSI